MVQIKIRESRIEERIATSVDCIYQPKIPPKINAPMIWKNPKLFGWVESEKRQIIIKKTEAKM